MSIIYWTELSEWAWDDIDGQIWTWPDCSEPDCTNKSCLRLDSDKCYPHSLGFNPEAWRGLCRLALPLTTLRER